MVVEVEVEREKIDFDFIIFARSLFFTAPTIDRMLTRLRSTLPPALIQTLRSHSQSIRAMGIG